MQFEKKVVAVPLSDLMYLSMETNLDLLEELWLADYEEEKRYSLILSDISFRPVGTRDDMVLVEVTAIEEEI